MVLSKSHNCVAGHLGVRKTYDQVLHHLDSGLPKAVQTDVMSCLVPLTRCCLRTMCVNDLDSLLRYLSWT